MLINLNMKTSFTYSFVIIITIISSCISSKKIKYLQNEEDNTSSVTQYQQKQIEYKLQSGDNVFIKFSSIEPLGNLALSTSKRSMYSQSMEAKYKDIYLIDSSGYISMPQLNNVFVKGLSLQQLKENLENKMKQFFSQVSVHVRLADNYVTIIGQVQRPGRYLVDFNDQISVFELIGMAGDLSFEANRKNVKLLRNNGSETEVVSLDLTKGNIIENKYYTIMPNDILYVEPLKAISWDKKSFPFATTLALVLATTTSILVIISYLK